MLERGIPVLLACGFRPPNVFSWMRAAARAPSRAAQRAIDDELRHKPAEAFDSHPPSAERIRRAEQLPEPDDLVVDDRPATALLRGDPERNERAQTTQLLEALGAPDLPVFPDDGDLLADAVLPTLDKTAAEARARAAQLFGEDAGRDDESALRAFLEMAMRSDVDEPASPERRAMGAAVREMVAPGIGALLACVERARGGELAFDGVERPSVDLDGERTWPFEEAADAVVDAAVATRLLARLDA
jgi:hypothetical protein